MRNYIILNDINSNTINGLLIQELPPISKPKMRTRTEEIDGRAGDIVTQLGFKAYDKTIKIGLYGDFDINEVISYFNSSGQVVFSNEPDKYYNYQIVDQIDYERLIRFRTAKVKMHVQPFKYPTEEEPLVGQYQYVSDTGSNLSLNNTANALFKKFDLKGNTSQIGTPTPSSPIPVNVVSGDNYINICGKNLLDINAFVKGRINNTTGNIEYANNVSSLVIGENNISFVVSQAWNSGIASDFIPISTGSYVFKYSHNREITMCIDTYDSQKTRIARIDAFTQTQTPTTRTFTISDSSVKYIRIHFEVNTANVEYIVSEMQLEKGSTSTTYEPYIGNTYPIYLGVENLFDLPSADTLNGITYSINDDKTINLSGTATANTSFILYKDLADSNIINGDTYTFFADKSLPSGVEVRLEAYNGTTWLRHILSAVLSSTVQNTTHSANTTNATRVRYHIYIANGTSVNLTNLGIQLEKGSKANSYTPYGTTPIELCKIGTYQDYIYKENGSWYLHKEIGKVVLDGSEAGWSSPSTNRFNLDGVIQYIKARDTKNYFSTHYVAYNQKDTNADFNTLVSNVNSAFDLSSGTGVFYTIRIKDTNYSSLETFKTWLSTNNVTLYYVLATPTNTLIEDTTLIEQLEEIKSANSYEGQTNISHDSNDAPFLVDVSALQSGTDELVVDNEGNIYSRPTLDLEGTGIVNVYLEGNQMFQVDLTDTNEIVIDTDEMEAYNPTTQALMNRQVTGNYDNFKLNVGDNTLKFSGDLTKATVTNYVRWL